MATRTYQLEDVGLELFLRPGGRASLYLTFASPAARDAAMRQLAAQPALRLAARWLLPRLVYQCTVACCNSPYQIQARRDVLLWASVSRFVLISRCNTVHLHSRSDAQRPILIMEVRHPCGMVPPDALTTLCARRRSRRRWRADWRAGRVSNFEYLMFLNREAGRSFQDLTQYPVFPWVVADYASAVLDLDSDATFRRVRGFLKG